MQTILLVEDSKFLRVANERLLTKSGYRVLCAADGEEALRIACENIPDLILLDMMLPKVPGEEVLEQLKQNPATAPIPVIVLSGLSNKNEKKLRKEGAVAFVSKDLLAQDSRPLLMAVKQALDQTGILV